MKAIGIFFVVLGHTGGISEGLRNYIYSFHIPLFFFLAGYLLRPESLDLDFARFRRRYFQALIVPYWIFGVISYLIWTVATYYFSGRDAGLGINPLQPLAGIFYGVGVNHWLQPNVALWFFPALFCQHLIFYWLRRFSRGLGLAYAVIGLSLLGAMAKTVLPFRLPWSVEPAACGLLFYWTGYFLRRHSLSPAQVPPWLRCLALPLLLAIQLAGIAANGRVDLNGLMIRNLADFYLTAFCGIAFWTIVAQSLPSFRVISAVARESLIIFPLQTFCFSLLTLIITTWFAKEFSLYTAQAACLYTVATLAVLTTTAPLVRKALP
jgi:acyltransferase